MVNLAHFTQFFDVSQEGGDRGQHPYVKTHQASPRPVRMAASPPAPLLRPPSFPPRTLRPPPQVNCRRVRDEANILEGLLEQPTFMAILATETVLQVGWLGGGGAGFGSSYSHAVIGCQLLP